MKLLNTYSRMRKLLILLVALLTFWACNNDSECRQERYVAMEVKLFQTKFDAEEETYIVSNFMPDSISVYGVGNDSILYNGGIEKIKLPLRKTANLSQYVFYVNGRYDTIKVLHENIDNYLSMECGCVVFANINEVTHTNNAIDSAIIRVPEVINVSTTHVEIYYREDK